MDHHTQSREEDVEFIWAIVTTIIIDDVVAIILSGACLAGLVVFLWPPKYQLNCSPTFISPSLPVSVPRSEATAVEEEDEEEEST